MAHTTKPTWRFKLGTPLSFYSRSVFDLTDLVFTGSWTDDDFTDIDGNVYPFKYTSTGSSLLTFTGTGIDLYVIRKDSSAPAFGWMSSKLSASAKNTFAALTNRNCYGNTSTFTNDTFNLISELEYGSYDLKISSLSSLTNIGIYGGLIYGQLTTDIYDNFNAFTFDVNPNSWEEGITGGTIENNMAGVPVLTRTQSAYREITISGQMISGYADFKIGGTNFIQNMRTKFEYYAEMQTKLLLIDDKNFDNMHTVYIVPGSFSVDRRNRDGERIAYSYTMTLKEINREH